MDFNKNCINDFLGNEIVQSRLVQDSIIPEQLSQDFEEPLTIAELDISAEQGNKSASGMDGLSNCFIKKYWELLRTALHRYSTHCHGTGVLTPNFKTASIKLIPKKGDTTKLKNWRPISLLSCLYKVISRALNNRLKKASGYIFSRAQKGFTSDRHIQEVLINVIEMIAHCKQYDIPGAIVSIDQAKAFDTISHKYMSQVYKFFGFGQNFIKLLETLGNGRNACIAFDDGTYSPAFDLKCGRAQGNTLSPTEYNMGQQIFLFKIELCPEIRSVYYSHFIARPFTDRALEYLPNPAPDPDLSDPKFRNESAFETSKSDGFADDNTTGTIFEFDSLNALKLNLDAFASFSGLRCNTEKTVVMPVGHKLPMTNEILSLGFNFSDSIHILGMDIDSELLNLDTNFEKTVTSLKNSVEYWERYYLTLPGRINVIKSLLFPLILYLGCLLMPSQGKLKLMQTTLDNFAIGSLNFGKKRITMPVEQGGLGLFDVEEFLSGQQAGWVLKAKKSSRDNWRCNLRSLCYGNVLCAGPDLISPAHNPILFGIAKSFACFRSHHDLLHSNFTNAFILNNKIFTRGPRDKGILTYSYLELDETANCCISQLKACEFFNVNGLKTRLELILQYGINLTLSGYANLALCLNNYVRKLRPNHRNNGSSRDICTEFLSLRNPGKKNQIMVQEKNSPDI